MAMSTPVGTQALDATVALLSRFEDAPFEIERRASSLVIKPTLPETFPITLYDQGKDAMLAAGRWHTHWDEPEQAAWGVFWLLTPYMRLVDELKNGILVATWVERYEDTGWEPTEPVFFLNPEDEESWPSGAEHRWTRRTSQHFLLPSPVPYDQICEGAKLDEEGLPFDTQPGIWVIETEEPMGPSLY